MDMAFGNKGGMRGDRNIRPSAKHQTSTLEDEIGQGNDRYKEKDKIEEDREKQLLTMIYRQVKTRRKRDRRKR